MADFYEILQVHPKADQDAIEAAYQRLRELYDPSRLAGAADELVQLARQKRDQIDQAYATLSDPVRRASYDESQVVLQEALPAPVEDLVEAVDEAPLDYRPLPPAHGEERPKVFNAQPYVAPTRRARRSSVSPATRRWLVPVLMALVVVAILGGSFALTGWQNPFVAAPAAQPTDTAFNQFESLIAQTKQIAEVNPNNAQAWIDYGNMLYDSVQMVQEQAPDSALYQTRLPRWLEAIDAYTEALKITPDNASVRADLATSACAYGVGMGDLSYVMTGLSQAQQAISQDSENPRVLLSLGQCLVSQQPAQTTEAIAAWQKIVEIAPDTAFAVQAQTYIERYSTQ